MKSLGLASHSLRSFITFRLCAFTLTAGVLMAWLTDSAHAWLEEDASPELRTALGQQVQQGRDATLLAAVYVGTNPTPYWLSDNGLNERGQQALETLHNATAHGINPDRYQVDAIEAALLEDTAPEALAKADTLISHGLIQLAQDLKAGVSHTNWYDKLGTTEAAPAPEAVWSDLKATPELDRFIARQAPQSPLYASLQTLLADYSALAKQGGWPQLAAGASLKPGMSDPRVAALRERLARTGDYDTNTATANTSSQYDDALVAAVKHFQKRHGLEADGAVGPATLTALNVPVESRIDQIRTTMDQIRQLPDQLGEKFILVNLPGYRLTAYEDGKAALKMRVVVGQPARKTPLFSNAITQAVFNPDWSVPPRIAREDFPRKLQANPNYLAQNGFTVYADGAPVDPALVDWQSVSSYSLRQSSGSGNALGKIKFPIPDNQSVYLHDTSHRELFSKAERALSSGCIRVANPEALAQFVLKGNEGWDEKRIAESYASRSSRTVNITPVPVHTVYWTAWVDAKGTPHFYKDIYKRDGAVLAALDAAPRPAGTQLASR